MRQEGLLKGLNQIMQHFKWKLIYIYFKRFPSDLKDATAPEKGSIGEWEVPVKCFDNATTHFLTLLHQ